MNDAAYDLASQILNYFCEGFQLKLSPEDFALAHDYITDRIPAYGQREYDNGYEDGMNESTRVAKRNIQGN